MKGATHMTDTVPDTIPIKSQTRTIQECFRQCLYEVPMFQRPYSWETDQLEDYWNDVILAKGDFFFGSTVTWVSIKRELFNDTYSIIDGQQRLTTSTIALSVIRDAFTRIATNSLHESNEAKIAQNQSAATQKYLIASDDDGNDYPVLKRDEGMFYAHIQRPNAIPSTEKWNGSAKRIGEARKYFEKRIIDSLEQLTPSEQINNLKNVRDNVLKARLIQVELASEEDGFLIFETLNTRGADLRLSDLVKNLLIRDGSQDSQDRDTIASRWHAVAQRVQGGSIDRDTFDRFIWQSWNSRRNSVTEPQLFKAISDLVKEQSGGHIEYLKELEIDSVTYQHFGQEVINVSPKSASVRDPFAIPEFVDSVKALSIFNVSVANSTVLAVARKFRESKFISEKQLIDIMRAVEIFHFQFSALTNSGSTGGTRGRYNRFAVTLEQANSRESVSRSILDLKNKLQGSLPKADKVQQAFTDLFYAPKVSLTASQKSKGRKIFITYVLLNFAKFYGVIPSGQTLSTWTIEHIKPQDQASGLVGDSVYSIGNLTLLTSQLNSSIGNGNFPDKLEALKSGSAYCDPVLINWASNVTLHPSDDQIKERAMHLASDAIGNIWKIT